ncbi:hypothetical protein AWV80_33830 [Cupriavidus sp. UYMU48A]|nr:hypothetical protein AWV80_33830 [Cupriavidus sp. UYMU48A]
MLNAMMRIVCMSRRGTMHNSLRSCSSVWMMLYVSQRTPTRGNGRSCARNASMMAAPAAGGQDPFRIHQLAQRAGVAQRVVPVRGHHGIVVAERIADEVVLDFARSCRGYCRLPPPL